MTYITITGLDYCFGRESFKVGNILYLEKEEDNEKDDEAIRVVNENKIKLGYVANSVHTVARGCKSAGYIHHLLEKTNKIKVMFIIHDCVIAQLVQ